MNIKNNLFAGLTGLTLSAAACSSTISKPEHPDCENLEERTVAASRGLNAKLRPYEVLGQPDAATLGRAVEAIGDTTSDHLSVNQVRYHSGCSQFSLSGTGKNQKLTITCETPVGVNFFEHQFTGFGEVGREMQCPTHKYELSCKENGKLFFRDSKGESFTADRMSDEPHSIYQPRYADKIFCAAPETVKHQYPDRISNGTQVRCIE